MMKMPWRRDTIEEINEITGEQNSQQEETITGGVKGCLFAIQWITHGIRKKKQTAEIKQGSLLENRIIIVITDEFEKDLCLTKD